MAQKVCILGPGYTGREIIDALLTEGNYDITTLVRRQEAADEFKKDGVKTHLSNLDDSDLIKKLTRESDVVFHTATADHMGSVLAILDGIEARAAEGKQTIYLHQSGAALLSDGSSAKINSKVYSDLTPDDIDSLDDSAPHRLIDLAIVKKRAELGDKAKIFMMLPPLIYGVNPKYQRLSIQIPTLIRFANKHGYAGYVDEGQGAWGVVHITDLVTAYLRVLHWLEMAPSGVALEHPYFFCESGEINWADLAGIIGEGLYKAGNIKDPTPRTITQDQWSSLFGPFTRVVFGCNARNRAERLRKLGWEPTYTDLKKGIIEEDFPVLLKEPAGTISTSI